MAYLTATFLRVFATNTLTKLYTRHTLVQFIESYYKTSPNPYEKLLPALRSSRSTSAFWPWSRSLREAPDWALQGFLMVPSKIFGKSLLSRAPVRIPRRIQKSAACGEDATLRECPECGELVKPEAQRELRCPGLLFNRSAGFWGKP